LTRNKIVEIYPQLEMEKNEKEIIQLQNEKLVNEVFTRIKTGGWLV